MGLIGGCLLIGTDKLISMHWYFHKGWWIILPYALVLIASMLILRLNKNIEMNYQKAFIASVIIFMLMTIIMYLYICIIENPISGITVWGHTWRMLIMLGFAVVSGAYLGLFFIKREKK
jgi:hypothetical protein